MILFWERIELFTLFFSRTASFVILLPIAGNRLVPAIVKTGFAAFISIILVSLYQNQSFPLPHDTFGFFFRVSVEVFIGLALGFITLFLFTGIQIAGEVMGMQMGLAMAKMVDPSFQAQLSIVAQFQVFIAMLFYLAMNGHHFLIEAFVYSYQALPLFADIHATGLVEQVINMVSFAYVVAVKVGAPVIVSLLLANIALGILARTVPQMNIFMVGLPLRLLLGIGALALTIRMFHQVFSLLWVQFQQDFLQIIHAF